MEGEQQGAAGTDETVPDLRLRWVRQPDGQDADVGVAAGVACGGERQQQPEGEPGDRPPVSAHSVSEKSNDSCAFSAGGLARATALLRCQRPAQMALHVFDEGKQGKQGQAPDLRDFLRFTNLPVRRTRDIVEGSRWWPAKRGIRRSSSCRGCINHAGRGRK